MAQSNASKTAETADTAPGEMATNAAEWYVILHGYGSMWTPISVVLGRMEALTHLTTDFPVTQEEERKLRRFYADRPAYGATLHLVGHFNGRERVLDRKLTRVVGPSLMEVG